MFEDPNTIVVVTAGCLLAWALLWVMEMLRDICWFILRNYWRKK